MLILEKKNRSWLIATLIAVCIAALIRWRVSASGRDVSASSQTGLWFGVVATLLMLFATLLWVNRRLTKKKWWLFRREIWLRGHLWLGTLAVVLVFFHAGWRLGGALTTTLWVLTVITTLTGWFGVLVQQYIPNLLSADEREIPLQQLEHVCREMQREADNQLEMCCGWEALDDAIDRALDGKTAAGNESDGGESSDGANDRANDMQATVARFYAADVRPYFQPRAKGSPLTNPRIAEAAFERIRRMQLPQALSKAVDRLETLCARRRQLAQQLRLHQWLHGWLIVHVPVAFALMLLSIVHAVTAVLY